MKVSEELRKMAKESGNEEAFLQGYEAGVRWFASIPFEDLPRTYRKLFEEC